MESRWFIVPKVSNEVGSGNVEVGRPKYSKKVDKWSGNYYDLSDWSFVPLTGKFYIVKFKAEKSVLDEIESKTDAFTRQEYNLSESDIAERLNQEFDQNLTFSEWQERFDA